MLFIFKGPRAPYLLQRLLTGCLLLTVYPRSLKADELSLLQGFYKQAQQEGGLKQAEVRSGARYSQQFQAHLFWYGEGELSMKSYSGANSLTPNNSNDITLGGGLRYYLDRVHERVAPFLTAGFSLGSQSQAQQIAPQRMLEEKQTGLFYHGHIGLRFSLSSLFFLDLQTPLFHSTLTSKERKTETLLTENGTVESTTTSSRQELFVNTQGALSSLTLALGIRI